jgi:hypothetical protein
MVFSLLKKVDQIHHTIHLLMAGESLKNMQVLCKIIHVSMGYIIKFIMWVMKSMGLSFMKGQHFIPGYAAL